MSIKSGVAAQPPLARGGEDLEAQQVDEILGLLRQRTESILQLSCDLLGLCDGRQTSHASVDAQPETILRDVLFCQEGIERQADGGTGVIW